MRADTPFQAFVLREEKDGGVRGGIEPWTLDQLPEGDVTVKVSYSGVNYKDGLASIREGKIVRKYPFIPGIDLAGTVMTSSHPDFQPGDKVLCTGYEVGVSHDGGYSEYARVRGDWLVPLPSGLLAREAMAIGTAGFTAALSVDALLRSGLRPDQGPVLVTGATGGVGSFAVSILSRLGYHVTAATGKQDVADWLRSVGASEVVSRDEAAGSGKGALSDQRWAAAVDPVGGAQLGEILKHVKYGGAVAVSGMTGGLSFESSVYPFILRGVSLFGIDSVYCPMERRTAIWSRLANEWKPEQVFAHGIAEYNLDQLPELLHNILQGKAIGRSVIVVEK